MKPPFERVIAELDLLNELADFDPMIIGTPPLGLAIEGSDIDIACSAADFSLFEQTAERRFKRFEGFASRRIEGLDAPARTASFRHAGWEIELFCQALPTRAQQGVRHFLIERRILALAPDLREDILELKRQGLKTEPAFARRLSLSGDPYLAMLDIESKTDKELLALIASSP